MNTTVLFLSKQKMASRFENYTNWSIHDLRKSLRTGIADLTQLHIAEIMLGHKSPGVWQRYTRSTPTLKNREKLIKAGGVNLLKLFTIPLIQNITPCKINLIRFKFREWKAFTPLFSITCPLSDGVCFSFLLFRHFTFF
ncbi:MAG: hypothetical protein ACL7BU_15530 [Candidatus Phlomobacter fragariae]